MLSRIAGFFSGMGGSFAAIALVVLLRRRLLGAALLLLSAAGKAIAAHIYGKQL